MRIDVEAERHVALVVGNFPGEAAEDHAHKDDGDRPYIGETRVVLVFLQDFRREVRVGTDDSRSGDLVFTGIVEDCRSPKVDELDDVVRGHDAVVELEISVRQPHPVEIIDTVDNLPKDAVDFRPGHLARHDDREEVIRRIFHNLHQHYSKHDLPRRNGRDH